MQKHKAFHLLCFPWRCAVFVIYFFPTLVSVSCLVWNVIARYATEGFHAKLPPANCLNAYTFMYSCATVMKCSLPIRGLAWTLCFHFMATKRQPAFTCVCAEIMIGQQDQLVKILEEKKSSITTYLSSRKIFHLLPCNCTFALLLRPKKALPFAQSSHCMHVGCCSLGSCRWVRTYKPASMLVD